MFSSFAYESISLRDILLDDRNPRIVTQKKLSSQEEILKYLFEHENLADFIKKIAAEGKNPGAERPYIVKSGKRYIVIEGNTRIAAYKLLTGLLVAPKDYSGSVPNIPQALKDNLQSVDCSIAPNRDALLPIMASAHFGLGDKTKWGYLGSRKAVHDEWRDGKTIAHLARVFDRTQSEIKELILEYLLYLKAISLKWTKDEKNVLLNPAVEFNPPVRFLQTRGHKAKVGVNFDKANIKVLFDDAEAEKKFRHLVLKLVVNPKQGLGATAGYDEVFIDYAAKRATSQANADAQSHATGAGNTTSSSSGSESGSASKSSSTSGAPPTALFAYPISINSGLLRQLMKEAKSINFRKFPAAATFLLRNIVETILKDIIHQQKANPATQLLDLEKSINLCMSNAVTLGADDKRILKEFQKSYVSYLNLGAHGNVIPNPDMLAAARDCIDQFVKRNV